MSKEQLDRIEGKVDKLDERLDKHDVHLAKYNEQLEYHIKRTELLEGVVETVTTHINRVQGALKLFTSAGIILTIIKILEQLK